VYRSTAGQPSVDILVGIEEAVVIVDVDHLHLPVVDDYRRCAFMPRSRLALYISLSNTCVCIGARNLVWLREYPPRRPPRSPPELIHASARQGRRIVQPGILAATVVDDWRVGGRCFRAKALGVVPPHRQDQSVMPPVHRPVVDEDSSHSSKPCASRTRLRSFCAVHAPLSCPSSLLSVTGTCLSSAIL